MKAIDWSSFTRREYYKANIETVLKAYISQAAIESRFLEIALFFNEKGSKDKIMKLRKEMYL